MNLKCKVVIVGAGGTGKTTMVKRYIEKTFKEEGYRYTIGAVFSPKKVIIDERELNLDIYDTGGFKQYEFIAPTFVNNAKAALVCFDLSKEETFEAAKSWVDKINEIQENCKVYMCGTKKDKVTVQQLKYSGYYAKIHGFCEIHGFPFFETSAKTNEGIDDMFNYIAKKYLDSVLDFDSQPRKRKPKSLFYKFFKDCCPCSLQ